MFQEQKLIQAQTMTPYRTPTEQRPPGKTLFPCVTVKMGVTTCCVHFYRRSEVYIRRKVEGGGQKENHPQLQAKGVTFDDAFEGQMSWKLHNWNQEFDTSSRIWWYECISPSNDECSVYVCFCPQQEADIPDESPLQAEYLNTKTHLALIKDRKSLTASYKQRTDRTTASDFHH